MRRMTNGNEDELERQRQEHPTYFAQHQKLTDIETESYKISDGFIVSLASGGLGFSITLVEKIAPQLSLAMILLVVSWVLFAVAIVVTVYSYEVSAKAMRRQREILNLAYEKGGKNLSEKEKFNEYGKSIESLNTVARYSFIFGVILLCFFSITILLQKEWNHDTTKESPGRKERHCAPSAPIAAPQNQIIFTLNTQISNINQKSQEVESMSKDASKSEQPKSLGNERIKAGLPAPINAIPPPPPPSPKK